MFRSLHEPKAMRVERGSAACAEARAGGGPAAKSDAAASTSKHEHAEKALTAENMTGLLARTRARSEAKML